jgi:hypothetical protein
MQDVTAFDSKFYEARALWKYAQLRRTPVRTNVRLPAPGVRYSNRPEVDGIMSEGRYERAIEVKAFPLTRDEAGAVAARYADLGFRRLTLVAPRFEGGVVRSARIDVECVEFLPNVKPLHDHYAGPWHAADCVDEWLAGGGIHFRYSTAQVSRSSIRRRRTLNQTDKNLRSTAALALEVRRRVLPRYTPVRVHWSPYRFLFPKDLYFRRRHPSILTSAYVFDLDGLLVHRAMFPCTIEPATGLCSDCVALAKQHAKRLVRFLRDRKMKPSVFFSGHAGFHIYVLEPRHSDHQAASAELVDAVLAARVQIDRQVSLSRVPIIAFPTSVHGYSMRKLVAVERLESFRIEDAPAEGDP